MSWEKNLYENNPDPNQDSWFEEPLEVFDLYNSPDEDSGIGDTRDDFSLELEENEDDVFLGGASFSLEEQEEEREDFLEPERKEPSIQPQEESEFANLSSLSSRQEIDEDIDEIIASQRVINRSTAKRSKVLSKNLLDDPVDYVKEYDSSSGDEKVIKRFFLITVGVFAVTLISIITIFVVPVLTAPDQVAAPPTSERNIGIGDVITGSSTTAGATNSVATPSSTSAPTSVVVPDGGSKIDYSITTEGGIQGVSVAWVGGSGSAETATGVSTPWNMSVGAASNVVPVLAATTTGTGTITCKILKDGNEIAVKTVSGDSPEVTCES